MLGFCSIIR